ncbi:MAG: hypothetical protein ACJ0A5_08385 [Candidatus Puniceispirillales bacterium]
MKPSIKDYRYSFHLTNYHVETTCHPLRVLKDKLGACSPGLIILCHYLILYKIDNSED